MTRACREYVSSDPTGVPVEDYDLLQSLRKAVQGFRQAYARFSWEAIIVHNLNDIENALLEPEEILRGTSGKLPAMWVNFTYNLEDIQPGEFASIEEPFGLKLLGSQTEGTNG